MLYIQHIYIQYCCQQSQHSDISRVSSQLVPCHIASLPVALKKYTGYIYSIYIQYGCYIYYMHI